MKWLNDYRKTLFLVGCAGVLVLSSSDTKADFTFGEPMNLGTNVNSGACDDALNISSDGLSIMFSSDRPDWGTWDLYMATRQTTKDEWGPAVKLGSTLNGPRSESYPSLSADGLELFYTAPFWQAGWTQFGGADLWISRRSALSDNWSAPVNLGESVNTSFHDTEPSISADGLELYFSSDRPGGYGESNIWVTRRETRDGPWEEPVNLGPTINSGTEGTPNISPDGLVLLFASSRPGGHGEGDIWLSRRRSKEDRWQDPVNIGSPVNDSGGQWAPCISHDGSMLYFTDSTKAPKYGCFDIWQVSIEAVVDFNGDSQVDGEDVLSMVAHWGQDYPSCDIGPMPFGDGIVDIQDLRVLAEYIGEPVDDPTLVAHWAFDETEGIMAADSAGENDATVMGVPAWQPDKGMVGGALEFDGATFVVAGSVLDPSDGPFSVLAWVKGGQPGQGIITQQGGVDWLYVDVAEGQLATELSRSLCSQTVIVDGDWHRVGVTWDGSACLLYVDDVLQAESTEDELASSTGGIVTGCRKTMAGTFFTGLIDDIRIYNRAVKP